MLLFRSLRRDWRSSSAKLQNFDKAATQALIENWKVIATNSFNFGGLIGTLLTIPDRQTSGA